MQLFVPPRSKRIELLDHPEEHAADLHGNLRDIRVLNRWFGGASLAVRCVRHLLPPVLCASILDVATGSADIPAAVFARCNREGAGVRVTAVDISAEVLCEARRLVGNLPIELVQDDARSLPFDDDTFDVVMCCLSLHHFDPEEAIEVLREMRRVARHAILVTDLCRGYLGYAGAWLATRTVARNRLTQNDGPLSVLRSYRPREIRVLARAAGIEHASVRRRPFFRLSLMARLDGARV